MKTISIITLGCKVNQVESEKLGEKLEAMGYAVSMGLGTSDIYVLNTCAVTNEAERKSRNYISKIRKINPNAKIYVCGCSAENNAENFKKGDFVMSVTGTKDKLLIAEKIKNDDKMKDEELFGTAENSAKRVTNRTRADLCVQVGCNNFCTYCIIPYLRGRETSFSLESLKEEVKILETQTKEVVITGINLSSYGKDLDSSDGLIEIARLFRGSPARFRFSSLEANVITEEFLQELATFPNFCDHFHRSLQSGANSTLKAMNRHYTKEEYFEKVELIRRYFPNSAITTDIIVGFPTETDEDFNESYEFAKKVGFAEMHIFPYSKRKGTVAEKLKNVATNVPAKVKKMTELAKQMKDEFLKKNLGKNAEVIIENKKNGYFLAHTKNYILCYIKSDKELKSNDVYEVKMLEIYGDGVTAEIIN